MEAILLDVAQPHNQIRRADSFPALRNGTEHGFIWILCNSIVMGNAVSIQIDPCSVPFLRAGKESALLI